ncbi:hypothetical protein [Caballeronia sp. 15711]|uniref:hypothetical protein n=1 Tax=Caballeronia sp. 15711 TaxID=3391029 RepID=UPI0039E5F551
MKTILTYVMILIRIQELSDNAAHPSQLQTGASAVPLTGRSPVAAGIAKTIDGTAQRRRLF